ncbi:Kunitz trypsin inhibitor 2 [Tanacetum coccineum]
MKHVILLRFEIVGGATFTFTPVKSSEDVIKLGHPLAVQSPSHNPCGDSTVWKVSTRDGLLTSIITTGGIINTGPSCLVINKAHPEYLPNVYMFEYCPYMCGGAKTCWPLGIYPSESDGYVKQHLSPNPVIPFWFVLIKKSESAAKKELASF